MVCCKTQAEVNQVEAAAKRVLIPTVKGAKVEDSPVFPVKVDNVLRTEILESDGRILE